MEKLYSEACERNKYPILEKIQEFFNYSESVIEIGSGTGQHAVFFAENLPNLIWQTSDMIYSHESIKAWIEESKITNVKQPLLIDVSDYDWSNLKFDSAFTANTFHIMSKSNVEDTFSGLSKVITKYFCVYGPFNYNNQYTSQSNADFDLYIQSKYPEGGIRDIEYITELSEKHNFKLVNDFAMPSNNRLLVFKKV